MRIIGLILVLLGGFALGLSDIQVTKARSLSPRSSTARANGPYTIPPIASGIAVVSGLLLLASGGRRDEC